jgi:hypothetical protein
MNRLTGPLRGSRAASVNGWMRQGFLAHRHAREMTTSGGIMPKMRAVQVSRPNRPLEIVEREIPEPGTGQVRIKIEACGVCHSDAMTKEGLWPGIHYPACQGTKSPESTPDQK